MHGLLAAAGAELLQLKTIRRVTAVLRRDVVTLLALGACQGNFYAHLATSAYFFLISIRDFYTQKKDLNLCRVM